MTTFCNLRSEDIFRSIAEMKKNISECHILALCGGFSAGDEPDGSGKFIANVLNNKEIAEEIHKLLDRGGLILGICNGFQALVKSGLLPYGRLGMVTKDSPTLFRNDINRHVSQMVTTRVSTVNSPWLSSFKIGDLHTIAVSHGEGKFVVNEELAKELFANGQVAFQYVDPIDEEVTMESPTAHTMPSKVSSAATGRYSARWGIRRGTRRTCSRIFRTTVLSSLCLTMLSAISAGNSGDVILSEAKDLLHT